MKKKLALVLECMTQIPKLRPDNKAPAWVQQLIDASTQVRSDYLEKDAALKTGRAELHAAADVGHQAAISVYPIMQSIYRNDPVASESISKLPVADRTPAETLTRLESISKQWAELPNMPGTNKTFVAGETDKESFDELAAELRAKIKALSPCELQFKAAAAALNQQDEVNANFIAATLKQGRGQFPEDSQERKLIEAIAAPVSAATEPEGAAGASASGTATSPNTAGGTVVSVAGNSSESSSSSVPAPTPVNFVTPPAAVNQ